MLGGTLLLEASLDPQHPRSLAVPPSPLGRAESAALRDRCSNVMVAGADAAVKAFLGALTPYLQSPVLECSAFDVLSPESLRIDGTVILRDVERLDLGQQEALVRSLDEARDHVQIVAVTALPIYPLVEAGTFLDRLYYRLNVLNVVLTTP